MNGYNFTDRVRRTLQYARDEAARLGHEWVGTEHELLGILRVDDSVATAVLTNLQVDLTRLREMVEKMLKPGRHPLKVTDVPYTSRAKKVLEFSMSEARDLGYSYVGTQHLLLGLMREEKGAAAQALARSGVTLAKARAEAVRLAPPEEDEVVEPTFGGEADPGSSSRAPNPALNDLLVAVRYQSINDTRFAVVADLDEVPASIVAEVMAALDGLHRAWGGGGLRIEQDFVGRSSDVRVRS